MRSANDKKTRYKITNSTTIILDLPAQPSPALERMSLHLLAWSDLRPVHQRALLDHMIHSFEKPWADPDALLRRFLRPSCRVAVYAVDGTVTAAALLWKEPSFFYLDKFFVLPSYKQQRIGTPFLAALLSAVTPLVWRTDPILATRFYGKHPAVRTLGTHGEKGYVYQYASAIDRPWEYEDIAPLLALRSAFVPQNTT